ncbi:MAG: CPBP family intramembrane glutamic endopeptidase [Armatimonadota bacterium]
MSAERLAAPPAWGRVARFVGVTFAIDWALVGVMVLARVPLTGAAATAVGMAYMLVPALVVVVLARRWRIPLGRYGLRVPRRWELVLAPLAPMVITVLTVLVAVLWGFGELDLSGHAFIERMQAQGQGQMAEAAARQMERLPVNVVLLAFLAAPLAGFTINGLFGLGEELGWRGLLQRELAPLGFARSSALIGLIWGVWHAPLILLGQNFPEHPRLGVLVMTVACVLLGIILSWLALRAQTVLAAAVGHGTLNALAGVPMMSLRGGSNLEILQLGYAGIAAMALLVVAALIWAPSPPLYGEDEPAAMPAVPRS